MSYTSFTEYGIEILMVSAQERESRRHRTVVVEIGDWREEIDEVLAPLVREIWRAEIETVMSCQEVEPGSAWIEFDSVQDVLRFLDLVTLYEPGVDMLYNRINYQLTGSTSMPVWEFRFNLVDMFEGQDEQVIDGLASFHATVGVYFPRTDIPTLLQRLQAFNDAAQLSATSPHC